MHKPDFRLTSHSGSRRSPPHTSSTLPLSIGGKSHFFSHKSLLSLPRQTPILTTSQTAIRLHLVPLLPPRRSLRLLPAARDEEPLLGRDQRDGKTKTHPFLPSTSAYLNTKTIPNIFIYSSKPASQPANGAATNASSPKKPRKKQKHAKWPKTTLLPRRIRRTTLSRLLSMLRVRKCSLSRCSILFRRT